MSSEPETDYHELAKLWTNKTENGKINVSLPSFLFPALFFERMSNVAHICLRITVVEDDFELLIILPPPPKS